MVGIERINDRELRERPVVVAPLKSDSAKIWDVSSEAMEHGIEKGMELAMAKRMYRQLEVVNPNPDLYQSIHRKLLFKASRLTPVFEGDGLGKIYLDFTGFKQLYGNPMDFGQKFKQSIRDEFNLIPRVGISSNKLVSKAATDFDFVEDDIYQVKEKSMTTFLDPFPNNILPVIKEYQKQNHHPLFDIFEDLNLHTVQDLKGLDLITLGAVFPHIAPQIFEMARGIDDRVVQAPLGEPNIALDMHLEETNNQTDILRMLYALADKTFSTLRSQGQNTTEFKLALRYSDFKYVEKIVCLKFPVAYSHEIYAELKKAFGFLFSRRTSMRYFMIELRKLGTEHIQLGLFEDENKKLFDALDAINDKFPNKLLLGRGGSL